jgi:hypothetical protein
MSYITGLTANTIYYVRAYASNASGTTYGNEVTFTTSNTTTAIVDTVYITGTEANRAKIWVNGIGTALSSNQSSAYYIYLQNNDVYVTGADNNAGVSVPVYWKNGTANSLPNSGNICYPYGIAVNGGDVYIAGLEYLSGSPSSNAKLWKNSIVTNLPSNGTSAQAWSVTVSGTDVYVVGLEKDATSSVDYPILWKNGVRQILPNGGGGGAYSVFVSGVDVYVSGFSGVPPFTQPVYWKNGVMQVLPSTGPELGFAFSIFVSGTDVYAAGKDYNYATLWKNGIATHLTDGNKEAEANNVSVKGNNVYVVGNELSSIAGSNRIIKLWKNGTLNDITDGSAVAWVYGLYVK